LKGGRYENVEGGNANTALIHFTGGVSFTLDPTSLDAVTTFNKLDYCLHQQNALVTCITSVSRVLWMHKKINKKTFKNVNFGHFELFRFFKHRFYFGVICQPCLKGRVLNASLVEQMLYELTYVCDSAVFCALHNQLGSVDRHAQLTRCFSAVAELLVFEHESDF